MSSPKSVLTGALVLGAATVVIFAALKPFVIISPTERGVERKLGNVNEDVLEPGFNWTTPLLSRVATYDTTVQKYDMSVQAGTLNLQTVQVTASINWRFDPNELVDVYVTTGTQEATLERVLNPAISETIKTISARYSAEDLLSKRAEFKAAVEESLRQRMSQYGLVIESVNIADLGFTPEFNQAVERKEVARQQAAEAGYRTEQAKQEAQAAIERAKGEAEALRLIQETASEESISLRAIEAWEAGGSQVPMVMGGATPILPHELFTPREEEQPAQ